MNPPDENILVIRRSLFDELGAFQGLSFEPEKYLRAILSGGNNFFIPRPQAERDPAFKQIIPRTDRISKLRAPLRPRQKSRRAAPRCKGLDRHWRAHGRSCRQISVAFD